MDFRDYIILKANDSSVCHVYMGPQETPDNISEIADALSIVMRHLVKKYYDEGYDVIIARGRNLDSVKKSLPELRWSRSTEHHNLTEFAGLVPK